MILTSLGYESKSRTMANSRECAKLTLLCPPWRGPVVRQRSRPPQAGLSAVETQHTQSLTLLLEPLNPQSLPLVRS